ncbi:transposable element Tcb1 transposase [Trichonephila clavipes]|nr:transposable element Tcb1 transposase [Trichonephila clavipes]
MSRTKQRSAFDQAFEFDRGRIMAYRDCGLSFREIHSRVGRNQTTVVRICDRWMQEDVSAAKGVFTDESRICLQHHDGRIRVWRHRGERMLNSCVTHRHTGPAPGIMVWDGIGYHSRTPLVRIVGTLNSQRYISEIELLPWPAHSSDLSPIENLWSMVAQRLIQITPPAATPDQLWHRLEAYLLLYPKNTSKVSLNQCRGMWQL